MPAGTAVPATTAVIVALLLAGLFGTGATASAQEAAAKQLPRVYVFTQVAKPGQLVPPDQAGRLESVKDLREELRKKPGLLEVVDAPEPTDVTIEVTRRETPSATQRMVTVRLRVTGRSYQREFQGVGPTWKDAASLLTEVIRRWVNESYDTPMPSPLSGSAATVDVDVVLHLPHPAGFHNGGQTRMVSPTGNSKSGTAPSLKGRTLDDLRSPGCQRIS